MPNKDKHVFEKDMMQDAFEEEAFEGLSKLSDDELELDIIDLKSRISKKTKYTRRLIPVWYRYAASVVILTGIGLSILFLNSRFWQDSMLKEQISEEMEIIDSMIYEADLEMEKVAQSKNDTSQDLPEELIADNRILETKEEIVIVNDDVEIENELILDDSEADKNEVNFDNTMEIVEFDEEEEFLVDEAIAKEEPVVTEQALYAETEIIANNIEEENIGEAERGKNIEVTSQKSSQPMAVRAKKSSEEIITEYEVPENTELLIIEAKPPDHIEVNDLEKYIIEKIDYTLLSNYVGRHTINFTFIVETSGKLSDFNFTRSPNKVFNNEIIRVMTEAGNWIPATEENQNVNSFVRFTLKIKVE